jgi:hypothetical protein
MDVEQYYLDLKTQEPINYDGLIIYQPSFSEIKKYGIDKYNQIMLIYSLTIDCFDKLPDKENINLFDDLILNDDYLLTCLCESLYKLTKADEIILLISSKLDELIIKNLSVLVSSSSVISSYSILVSILLFLLNCLETILCNQSNNE